LSQVAAKRKTEMKHEHVLVIGHFHEQGSVLKGDAEGFCDGFDVEITLDSSSPQKEIETLIRLARRMCFTEKALVGSVPVRVSQKLNGQEIRLAD
jgi:organic hydroperoxide reductase OsmC/OhrA